MHALIRLPVQRDSVVAFPLEDLAQLADFGAQREQQVSRREVLRFPDSNKTH